LSFFDEDDGGARPPAPRPAAAGRGRGPTSGRPRAREPQRRPDDAGYDHHTMMVRRRIALGAGAAALVVIVLIVNGCLKSGKEEALKSYNREAGALVQESDQQVSAPLFKDLASAPGEPAQILTSQVDALRGQAQEEAAKAKALKAPGEMEAAQRNLTLAMDLREEALTKIAGLVSTAVGGEGKRANAEIAGAAEMFLASDVVWSQRAKPLIEQALTAAGAGGESTPGTQFLPNLGWLDPSTVELRLTGSSTGGAKSGPVAPGTHGSALKGVSVGGVALEAAASLSQVAAGVNPTFTVSVEDSGSNVETDVKVEVSVTAGGKEYKSTKAIPKTEPGVTAKAEVPVTGVPLGVVAQVAVYVLPVPGETNIENNKATYKAMFGG
jgi:hypothetical protein